MHPLKCNSMHLKVISVIAAYEMLLECFWFQHIHIYPISPPPPTHTHTLTQKCMHTLNTLTYTS